MFTGIVQAKGRIEKFERSAAGARLVVDRAGWKPEAGVEPKHGDSICVSGVCLTVVESDGRRLVFDVIAETLAKTNLGELEEGRAVNLEPAVTASQPLGGHFMQGHVDGVGEVARVQDGEGEHRITVRPPAELMDYVVPKGSVAIDGVSLTVAAVGEGEFEVALIPTTLELTTLEARRAGDRVNLEADILSKTVVNFLRQREQGAKGKREVSWATLREAGFTQG